MSEHPRRCVPRTRTAYPKRAEIGYGSASAGTAVLSPEVRRTPRTASAGYVQHQSTQVPRTVHEFHAPCVPATSERADPRKTGSRSRSGVPCTVQFRTREQFRTCTGYNFVPALHPCRTILEFRDREQVRRHVRVTRGVPYRRMRTPLSPRRRPPRRHPRRPPHLRRTDPEIPRSRYRSRFRLVSRLRDRTGTERENVSARGHAIHREAVSPYSRMSEHP